MGCCTPEKKGSAYEFNDTSADSTIPTPTSKKKSSLRNTNASESNTSSSKIVESQPAGASQSYSSGDIRNSQNLKASGEGRKNEQQRYEETSRDPYENTYQKYNREDEALELPSSNFEVEAEAEADSKPRRPLFHSHNGALPLRLRFGPLWIIQQEESQLGQTGFHSSVGSRNESYY